MKKINKTYIVLILFLFSIVPSYACYPDNIDDWADWCDDNDIPYNEYDTYEDYLANATDEQLDNWDGITNGHDADGNMTGSIGEITVTAPNLNNNTGTDQTGNYIPFPDPDPDPDYDYDNPEPRDCNDVVGGSAYLDDCQECVGGNTGIQPCDPCKEISDELANLISDNSTLMAVKQKIPSALSNGSCAPAGSIYRNGEIVNWGSIETSNIDLVSVSKSEYSHFDGINMLIENRDMYSKASNYGAGALSIPLINLGSSKIAAFLSKYLTKIMTKGCSSAMSIALSVYSSDMMIKSSFYSGIHDKLSQMPSYVGLYEIRTERTIVSSTGNSHSTLVEIYDTNGCLIDEMTFN